MGIAVLVVLGCHGPLTAPAMRRLDPDEQAQVDRMWNNMLVKPDRLDRELLLDVLLTFELHEEGVDRTTYHSEKDFAGGVVLMDMKYNRQKPLEDWFFVEILDHDKKVLRKEHYSGDEIWSHYQSVGGVNVILAAAATTQPTTGPIAMTQPATQPTDEELRMQWQIARFKQIIAATQPMRAAP